MQESLASPSEHLPFFHNAISIKFGLGYGQKPVLAVRKWRTPHRPPIPSQLATHLPHKLHNLCKVLLFL